MPCRQHVFQVRQYVLNLRRFVERLSQNKLPLLCDEVTSDLPGLPIEYEGLYRMLGPEVVDFPVLPFLPKERQTLMFSATMPSKIKTLSRKILKDPESIALSMSKPADGVLQAAYLVPDAQKIGLIRKLIAEKPSYHSILIFTATKKRVNEISNALRRFGMQAEGISSNLEQAEREAVLLRFRARKTRILVATDVLSRGIDIKDINLIINYDVPNDAEDYVHRVGRTARADTTGVAITLVNPADRYKLAAIERLIENKINTIRLPAFT